MSQDFSIRLQQWEATPPAESWSNIEARLATEEEMNRLGERLQSVEVPPPAGVWAKIDDQIHPTPVRKLPTPHHKTIPFYLRPVWVAAAMISFFVGSMWYYQVSPFDPSPLMQKSFNLSTYPAKTSPTEYIPYQSPSGQPIKISKRVHEAMFQAAGLVKSNQKKPATDAQLEEWRNQIRQSNFVPSPDNFMSILELQEMLAEKQTVHGQN